ncbi:glycosyltransferase, partial [bacterium]|nr:glycosyltransferase [bacterium]
HQEVLANQTYKHRARSLHAVLSEFLDKSLRFSIKIGVSKHEEKHSWGDYHFALAMQRALGRAGHHARIDILPDWDTCASISDDVVIVLRGVSSYKPDPSKINLIWLISHPDDVSVSELKSYDHIFVASHPALFHPDNDAEEEVPDVLFVGNSRGVRRQVIDDSLQAGLPVGVYGGGWDGLVPADWLRDAYIPNEALHRYYCNAKVLLNDHWPDMKREGFVSNRIFDAGACGAAIISDDVMGLRDIFSDNVTTYDGVEDLRNKVDSLLADDVARRAMGERLRRSVLERHTFDHRIRDILTTVRAFL